MTGTKWVGAVLLSLVVAGVLAGCAADRSAGRRFRAERELWKVDWDYQNLSIRPQDVLPEQWQQMASRYIAVADHQAPAATSGVGSEAARQTRTLSARALFSAARVYGQLRDSTRVEQLFERMAREFDDLPEVAGEVAVARGMIAERRGRLEEAAGLYQSVVDRVRPDPASAGVAGAVIDLPLRIARMRAQASEGREADRAYDEAAAWYERQTREGATELARLAARGLSAELATERRDWDGATAAFRALEEELRASANPPRPPQDARLSIANLQMMSGQPADLVHATLLSLKTDYPDTWATPSILYSFALNANQRGEVDEALGYLDEIVQRNKEEVEVAANALFQRGQLLSARDRWPQALEAYRSIPAQYPLSQAALRVPLEIAQHHARAGDQAALAQALTQAERDYRDFIRRYPPGPMTAIAREQLVRALTLQENFTAAIEEMVGLGEQMAGSPQGAQLLVAAAAMAAQQMADTSRAVTILERVGEIYKTTDVGQWASAEAVRLKGVLAR